MTGFRDILTGTGENLLKIFYVFVKNKPSRNSQNQLDSIARELKLKPAQLIVALGFNPHFSELTEIINLLGFKSIDDLLNERNEIFINDIYRKISLDNILTIYDVTKDYPEVIQVMQYLVGQRLKLIEAKIEETVNSVLIEKYKAEIKAIYIDGIASIDFAENRLEVIDSGFRALLNEVTIIIESRLIPAGDIFFRNTILPEEKRKLLNKGLIPLELVQARLEDNSISQRERKMLQDYLAITKQNTSGQSD